MSQKLSKTINAWCSYDIANSVYKLLITTVLFPIYYKAVTNDTINLLGLSIKNTVLYDYALAIAFLVIAFVSPLLSGIADYGGQRKRFMQVFTFLGAASCAGMYFFNGSNLVYGLLTIVLAAIGYEGAVLFYNSFLPRIADNSLHDRISARGYSWGYAGSLILLSINLFLLLNYEKFGFKNQLAPIRLAFLQVGIWWFSLSWIAFAFLKETGKLTASKSTVFKQGYKELVSVQKSIFSHLITRRFLYSFFFYSMGLQTLMFVAIMFGQSEIGIEGSKLIMTVLILQIVAIIGATLFAFISKKWGNKQSIISMLFIWLAVCAGGYFVQTVIQFYILSGGVGLVMGGIQSQSRSTFSKLIPKGTNDTASYFSFYNFAEKMAIVFGVFSFGFIEHITGSARNSTIALGIYFLIALIIIWRTPLNSIRKISI
jgi:MFS transporter, UMF1 family